MSTTAVTTEASLRRPRRFGCAIVIMALTIASFQKKASQKEFSRPRTAELTSPRNGLWSVVHPPAKRGEASLMSERSPRGKSAKKVAQSSLKEKRAEKRAGQESRAFLKPRKGASG